MVIKPMPDRVRTVFNKWHWSNWIPTGQNNGLDLNLTPPIEMSSEWISDLKVKL